MDWQEALRERLLANAGVSAAGRGVDWTARPAGSSLPCLVLQLVDDVRAQHLKGFASRWGSRVQFNAFATDQREAVQLREATLLAVTYPLLIGPIQFGAATDVRVRGSGRLEGPQVTFRESFDAIIWHN
jgi:hypothetical protein